MPIATSTTPPATGTRACSIGPNAEYGACQRSPVPASYAPGAPDAGVTPVANETPSGVVTVKR